MFFLLLATLNEEERSLAEQIYEKYNERMFTIAYSILKDTPDAEDAVENTAIRIIENIHEFIDISCNKTDALIVLYTKSASIDLYRKRKNTPILTIDADETPDPVDMVESVENTVLDNEYVHILKKYIDELDTKYRDVMIYKYFYGRSDREIVQILHLKENAVRTRLTRARTMLRQKMEDI